MDNCWNNCGLEASLWIYENDKTEEQAAEYFWHCYRCCRAGSSAD